MKELERNTLATARELSQVTQSPNQLFEALGAPVPLSGFFSYCPLLACSVASTEFLYTTACSLVCTILSVHQCFTIPTVQHCLHYTIVSIRPLLKLYLHNTLSLYFSQCPGLAGNLLFTGKYVVT